ALLRGSRTRKSTLIPPWGQAPKRIAAPPPTLTMHGEGAKPCRSQLFGGSPGPTATVAAQQQGALDSETCTHDLQKIWIWDQPRPGPERERNVVSARHVAGLELRLATDVEIAVPAFDPVQH